MIRLLEALARGGRVRSRRRRPVFAFPFDPAYAERLFLVHLMPRHLCLVHDVEGTAQGVLMAVAAEHPFGPVRVARETVWFIEPDYRGLGRGEDARRL